VADDPVAPPGLKRVLIQPAELTARIGELGEAIARDYAGREPVLVGVLTGAVIFLADLVRAIPIPLECDIVAVSSYGAAPRSSGVAQIVADLTRPIAGRDVLLVEDIVDTGRTVAHLLRTFEARAPRSVRVCALLDKAARREVPIELAYVGFTIPDEFVVGYGLDLGGRYRNLPYIAALDISP
jgi:hypoxanthine phosphoribosyltransferase